MRPSPVMIRVFCLLAVNVMCAVTAKAQVSEDQARTGALVAIKQREGETHLFSHRCEDMEDQFKPLWWLQYVGNEKAPGVFVFRVSDEGSDFGISKIDYHLTIDGGPLRDYVAVSAVSGETYRISRH
jgi:hypothetical protein